MAASGAAPARLGRYELIARLASGGMGEIFLARMEGVAGFEKLLVIKRILPHLADDPRFRDMLIAEARIASMMTHANVCHVYELGETDGQLYIVMEYLEGATVLPLLRRLSKEAAPLDLGFVAGVLQQATDGLHYAHDLKDRSGAELDIVHRDITPSNIFLTDAGVVKVLDFGIAKVKDASAHTQTGTVKGKYAYMSPEQLRGGAVDRRSDVFALGVVTYEMLALRRLFQRKTDYLTFRAVMEQPIVDIRHYRPDCPDPLAAVLARALDRDPANRYATARQLGSAVLDAVSAVRRPWSQGELGDFVSAQFAGELGQRRAQIAGMVHGGSGRQTMPVLVQADDAEREVTEDEFPPVDSVVGETPAGGSHVRGSMGEPPAGRTSSHAPASRPSSEQVISFLEPTHSGPGLEPLLGARAGLVPAPPPQAPVAVQPRRSLVWPLVAIAMVAVAGGALILVWQQMQRQHEPPTQVTIVPGDNSHVVPGGPNTLVVGADPVEPEIAGAEAPATGAGSSPTPAVSKPAASEPPVTPGHGRPARPVDPYLGVVRARQGDANRCATQHGNPPPGTKVQIVIAPDGHPRQVTIEPSPLGATPLGACIKAVFRGATFPRDTKDHQLAVTLVRPA